MITDAGLKRAMKRLETMYSPDRPYPQDQVFAWGAEFKGKGYVTDAVLMAAAEALILGEKMNYKPNLQTFCFYVREARTRLRDEEQQKKQYDSPRRGEFVPERGATTPYAKACCRVINDLLSGKITKEEFDDRKIDAEGLRK